MLTRTPGRLLDRQPLKMVFFFHKGNCHPTDPGHAVWAETALTALRVALEEGNR